MDSLMTREPQNHDEALTMGLVLAITAPTEEDAQRVIQMAEELAVGMTDEQVEAAKARALDILDMEEA